MVVVVVVEDAMRADEGQSRFLEGGDCLKCSSRRLTSPRPNFIPAFLEMFALTPSSSYRSPLANKRLFGLRVG